MGLPRCEVTTGQRVRALAGETVPVDAIVRSGAALVDQTALCGTSAPSRKVAGDQVLAGSVILAGGLDLEVLRIGDETRAARIAQNLIEATVPPPRPQGLNNEADDFAAQTVAPTLLTAGAGWAIGDLTTAAAILSPDYATGVGLAMPLQTLRDVRLAIRTGAVVRTGDAFARLAKTSWIILDDHEALHRVGCEVAEVRTKRLDENRLLPAVAAAGIWLGDERGLALARACWERGLIVRRADLRHIDADGVAIRFGDRLVRLRGRPVVAGVAPPPLIVEVDGVEEAGVRFRRNGSLNARTAIRLLQRDGVRVFLASERPADAAAIFARRLGVNRHLGEMRRDDKIRLLRELQQQRVASAYVGDRSVDALISREAHLSIALAGADDEMLRPGRAEIVLVGSSIAPLPALFALARLSTKRVQRTLQTALVPSLLSVAGAFVFEFTAMASVIISNLGTSAVYNRAKRSLLGVEGVRPGAGWDAVDDYASCASESSKMGKSA